MRDDDPGLLDRLEADLAAVEHAIDRLEHLSAETGDVVGAGDVAGRIRSVLDVEPFLAAQRDLPADPDRGASDAVGAREPLAGVADRPDAVPPGRSAQS